jgi:hypothetical protein
VLDDEPEASDRIVSWAKLATALRKISRSVRNSAFSLRNRHGISNSDAVTANRSAHELELDDQLRANRELSAPRLRRMVCT